MRLVPMSYLLKQAFKNKYGVPSLNISNLETIKAALTVANELRSPVIIAVYYGDGYNSGFKTLVDIVHAVGADMDLDVAIHLDHGANFEHVTKAIQAGFTSVMYDGSNLPLEENISNTKRVVEIGKYANVTVEAEVGTLGSESLTDPDAAVRLAETGIDCLAVAIGNAHGFYKGEPRLDFERLGEIVKRVGIPIVLHGGTGIPKEQIQRAITMGIAKINFGTGHRDRFVSGMKAYMKANPEDIELRNIFAAASEQMRDAVRDCISLCMSAGRCR
jgi:ketose-bisphosphate aldolase